MVSNIQQLNYYLTSSNGARKVGFPKKKMDEKHQHIIKFHTTSAIICHFRSFDHLVFIRGSQLLGSGNPKREGVILGLETTQTLQDLVGESSPRRDPERSGEFTSGGIFMQKIWCLIGDGPPLSRNRRTLGPSCGDWPRIAQGRG